MQAIPISEFKGLMDNDDERYLFVGLKAANDIDLDLALPRELVMQLGFALISKQKRERGKEELVIMPTWFEIGKVASEDSGDLTLSLETNDGSRLSYLIDRTMALRMKEVLDGALGVSPTPLPPGTLRN